MTRSFVVTGGGRGIGRAITQRLLDDGHAVVVVEVASAVAFLLSDEAGFINGAVLPVDGGRAVLGQDPEQT